MKELVRTMDGYQEQGRMAKQSTYNKNKVNPYKPHVMHQSLSSDEGEWNQMSIKQKSKQSYKYPMGKLKQSQTGPQQKIIKKRDVSMFTPNQQTSSNNQQKQEKKNLPVEANGKSTINILENNPLQPGWQEISKASFFLLSWFFSFSATLQRRPPPRNFFLGSDDQ